MFLQIFPSFKVFEVLELVLEDEWFIDPRRVKKALKVKPGKKGRGKYNDNKAIMVKKINALYGLRLNYAKNKTKNYNDDDIADAIAVYATWLKTIQQEQE
jgi:hypothetical protein